MPTSVNKNTSIKHSEPFLKNFSTIKIKGRNIKAKKQAKKTKTPAEINADGQLLSEHYVQFFFLS